MNHLPHLSKFNWSIWVSKSRIFSAHAHDSIGQKRKWSDLPYWSHTEAVADIVAEYTNNVWVICAANLHDTVEDVASITHEKILVAFNEEVALYVKELTDVYTHKAFPHLNRAKRKALECERLAKISDNGKVIKLADIIHNAIDIRKHDKGFAKLFFAEKKKLLEVLKPATYIRGNSELYEIALSITLD